MIELSAEPLEIIVHQVGDSARMTVSADAVCDSPSIEGYLYEEHHVGKQHLRLISAIGKAEILDLIFPRVYTIKVLVTCTETLTVPKYFRQEVPIIGLGKL